MQVTEFECGSHRFGVPLACVRRVVMSAAPAPLPGAPAPVLGVLNVGGQTVTVIDFASRAGCQPAPLAPSQQLLVIQLSGFLAALVVDRVLGVAERALADCAPAPGQAGAAAFVGSIVRLDDGLCVVVDPDRFLFEDEQLALAAALAGAGHA